MNLDAINDLNQLCGEISRLLTTYENKQGNLSDFKRDAIFQRAQTTVSAAVPDAQLHLMEIKRIHNGGIGQRNFDKVSILLNYLNTTVRPIVNEQLKDSLATLAPEKDQKIQELEAQLEGAKNRLAAIEGKRQAPIVHFSEMSEHQQTVRDIERKRMEEIKLQNALIDDKTKHLKQIIDDLQKEINKLNSDIKKNEKANAGWEEKFKEIESKYNKDEFAWTLERIELVEKVRNQNIEIENLKKKLETEQLINNRNKNLDALLHTANQNKVKLELELSSVKTDRNGLASQLEELPTKGKLRIYKFIFYAVIIIAVLSIALLLASIFNITIDWLMIIVIAGFIITVSTYSTVNFMIKQLRVYSQY